MKSLVVFALLLAACDETKPPAAAPAASAAATPDPKPVDGKTAHALVAKGAKLVDVRTSSEYADKHAEGAENVPLDTVQSHDFGPKDTPIIVYCHSGNRSAKAAKALHDRGYSNVYDLGGMSRWDE